jgi:hypothetical protein
MLAARRHLHAAGHRVPRLVGPLNRRRHGLRYRESHYCGARAPNWRSNVRPTRARRAVPPPGTTRFRFPLGSRAAVVPAGVVVPADGLELPHGGDASHGRKVTLAADLGRRCAASVANHADVCGLNDLQGHHVTVYPFSI